MSKNLKISAVISVFNGEKVLEECLKSVSWASEIIVVDCSSTDNTLEIAKKYTNKIYARPNNFMLNVNKNFGFSKANYDWILSLDADERITKELGREIETELKAEKNGYWIPRKNILFGKWIEHAGWYPDYQMRLFKKSKGKFPEEHVHEMIKIDGETGKLRENILHYNYNSISQFVWKLGAIYGPNEADQLIKKGYVFDWRDAIRFPVKEFLSRYFAREGYRDGFHGLMLSILMAFYHFIVFSYVWEKHSFKRIDDESLLSETEKEFDRSVKDISFWFSKEKIKSIKNPIAKIFYKILRRINP